MKRFRFRLQKLLDLARRSEEAARQRAAAALVDLHGAEDTESRATAQLQEARDELRERMNATDVQPAQIAFLQRQIESGESRLCVVAGERLLAEARYEKARGEVVEKKRELLVYERSREQSLENWIEEQRRGEAQGMEEAATTRHVRGGDAS